MTTNDKTDKSTDKSDTKASETGKATDSKTIETAPLLGAKLPVPLYDMGDFAYRNEAFSGRVLAVFVGTDLFTSAKGSDGIRMMFRAVTPPADAPVDHYANVNCGPDDSPLYFTADGYLTGKAINVTFANLFNAGWQIPEDDTIADSVKRIDARVDAAMERVADLIFDPSMSDDEREASWIKNFCYPVSQATAQNVKGLPVLGNVISLSSTTGATLTGTVQTAVMPYVELTLEEEEYPVGSGKYNTKVKGIWRPGGGSKSKTKEQAMALVDSLRQRIGAVRRDRDAAPATPTAQKSGASIGLRNTVGSTKGNAGNTATNPNAGNAAPDSRYTLFRGAQGTAPQSTPRVTVKEGAGTGATGSDEDIPF